MARYHYHLAVDSEETVKAKDEVSRALAKARNDGRPLGELVSLALSRSACS